MIRNLINDDCQILSHYREKKIYKTSYNQARQAKKMQNLRGFSTLF